MTIPFRRPLAELCVFTNTPSIGATPAAAVTVAPCKGRIVRTFAVDEGGATGTIAVSVIINAGSNIGALSLTGGAGNVGTDNIKRVGAAAAVNEGDLITFTPSGGSGATKVGRFIAVIARD